MRSIPSNPPTLDDITFPEELRERFAIEQGSFIIAGSTGSGKTTTFAACERAILEGDTPIKGCILTYEAPVEFLLGDIKSSHSFVSQVEIGTHLSLLSREPRQIVMNSGYRTPRHNATIEGAAPNSQHIHGKACDFNIKGVRPSDVHQVANSYNVPGLGRYRNFTHIDVGPAGRRWG